MNKKAKISIFLWIGLAFNCASLASLAPVEIRQKSFVKENTGVDKNKAYDRAAIWFSKNFNDSNSVTRLKDSIESRIIGKGTLKCDVSYSLTEADAAYHDFSIDFQARENKIRIKIENIWSYRLHPYNKEKISWGPTDEEDIQNVLSKCFEPLIVNPLVESISGRKDKEDNW
ncbi:DUF4468 domain-containing protein [Leptospira neocaledonica]|uniref:DUF4468 domain-containing protein n=1 Tax=Leptospira neocaledonica TaxID=2023192 RepID=A0A2M9ZT91_9LEPT|nr:DUF4468 domain-containing protein [Leptospira neocaledonica]PJZ75276.1 hypothetical protein CH365_19680 [Leptospira neocaledonica]